MPPADARRGLDPVRVAEVIARPPAGRAAGRRGSGYRTGPSWVLTAAHVVREAAPDGVLVRFEADRAEEWTVPARVVLASDKADVALLELLAPAPPGIHARPTPPPSYGAVPDADVTLPCSAMGFPRFKLRADPAHAPDDGSPSQYRDSCHATGMTSVLSNRREGTLELAFTAPESDREPERSPWEGMSGAAVWHDDTLIAVVSAHHRSDGLGRLAAVRVDRWYETLTETELTLLHERAGLPSVSGELVRYAAKETGPARLTDLPDSLPLRELDPLVGALTALPAVRNPTLLALVLDSIDPVVAAMSPRSPMLRVDVFGILHTCLRYRGTLDQFLEAIRLLEGDSAGVARLDQEAMELSRRHRRADEHH
ncbi:trypsin-like peptidase domain-containing protein [Streptomyces sp. NPDC005574]|uniref:effector-associated domain 2-containing protein n=1 Tax=Streptomyces sp. NPDC005574 TaxID=3156891 RepID=UPI0033BE8F9C